MQALPLAKPFINGRDRTHRLHLEIDLPALIPGSYALDFWVGPHFSETVDYVKNVAIFEIVESPTGERNYPHSRDHGFLVPPSRCDFLSNTN
jgi:hypothetical protein